MSAVILALPACDFETIIEPQPISVALPSVFSEATLNPNKLSTEPDFMITQDSNAEDEHVVQNNLALDSSSPFILESVHDPIFEPNQVSSYASCSLTQIIPQSLTTNVSPPPTLLLDFVILKEVCEKIFKDLTKLLEAMNHVIPSNIYEEQWNSLRERVDYVMFKMKKLSQEAHNQTLHNWFKDVARSMEEVELNINPLKSILYILDTLVYTDASSIMTSSVQSEDQNLSWLTKLLIHSDAPILEKLKRDSEQEQRIK